MFAEERGFPLITTYRSEQHRAGGQTFGLTQDPRGMLWFANQDGVLSYDGAWWSLLPLPHENVAFGVAANARGEMAAGAVDDFGLLERDARGALQFRSLVPLLPPTLRRGLGQFDVCATGDGFAFVAGHIAAHWNGRALRVLAHWNDSKPTRCLEDGPRTWFSTPDGLFSLDGAKMFNGRRVDAFAGDYVVVRNEGLFRRDETPLETDGSKFLRGKSVMAAVVLHDRRIAVATLRFGVVVLHPDGTIDQIIGPGTGLPQAILYGALVDRDGSLWVAMEGSIVRIDLAAPLTVLDDRNGLKGAVRDVVRHHGRIYAATSDGLFALDGATATHIENAGTANWSLLSHGDDLFVAGFRGVWRIRDGHPPEAIERSEAATVYDMVPSADGSRIWMAADEGLASLSRDGDGWRYDGMHPKVRSTVYRVTLHDGALWCGTLLDGVVRLDANGNIRQFGSDAMTMAVIGGRPRFAGGGRIRTLDANGQLVDDRSIAAPAVRFGNMTEDRDGTVWIDSRPPRFIRRGSSDANPLEASLSGEMFRIRAEADGVVWFATDQGLFRLGADRSRKALAQAPPMIRRIAAHDALLFGGFGGIPPVALPHSFGRLRVEFAPLTFRGGAAYQYRLEPIDGDWSRWTTDSFVDYTNLAEGDYTLRVRARTANGETTDAAIWSFRVRPPWFRTRWALALWIVVAVALVLLIVRLRTRTLRRRATQLAERVEEQTVELQKTVEQLRAAQFSLVEKNELLEDTNALLAQANVRLEKLSLVDALTSVANRREFDRALADEWERARRRQDPVSLILLDLDHFKRLNDSQGHPAGDEALRRVGRFLRETIRGSGDVVARYGGEEFAVILPGVHAPEAMQVAERLREGVEALEIETVGAPRLTISCGVTTIVVSDGREPRMLLDRADRALYAAKRAGRNRVHIEIDAATQQPLPSRT